MGKIGFQPNQVLGLIKFFRNEEFLDKLISGCMHCQPPEVYRVHQGEGVSDPSESCTWSWRSSRGDPAFELRVNDRVIYPEDIVNLTVHMRNSGEAWLHCWSILRVPGDQQALDMLNNDIARMKQEFGTHFAFIPYDRISTFLSRVSDATEKTVWADEVIYSEKPSEWDAACKSSAYSYQREYRLGIGSCSTHDIEPYIFDCAQGFSDLIMKSPDLKLGNETVIWFEIKKL